MPSPEVQAFDAVSSDVYVCVHGHFYQPPRENPSLEAVERQSSAAPFHDWNERILKESYRPNAFARIVDQYGQVLQIINNYEFISFNIGPTLMSWLARHDLETYHRILEADKRSCDRNNGHGNAIAQVYNHMILPLANGRDKLTQVRWGIADFRKRFKRDPEGMWLSETAIDQATLKVLIEEGIKFTIVAPSQVQRCRPLEWQADGTAKDTDWHEVAGGQIDPTRPYRCFVPGLPKGEDYIDIFVYDGPISGDMGFSDLLQSSQSFADRISQAIRGERQDAQLISVATDGETFGHHRHGAERALAYALKHEFADRGWQIVSYARYLSLFPPTWELQLKPVTAWSCSHGVERWRSDCGCCGGGEWFGCHRSGRVQVPSLWSCSSMDIRARRRPWASSRARERRARSSARRSRSSSA
ncbi:MAG: glycoside hydrolase, partial [Cyanobacteria bacterium P01_F01_bin.4]